MAKQSPNITYQWRFPEQYVEGCIRQCFKFFSPIYLQLYHEVIKVLWLIMHRVIIASNIYYLRDRCFIKSFILKPITEFWNARTKNMFGRKRKKINFKDRTSFMQRCWTNGNLEATFLRTTYIKTTKAK